MFVLHGTALSLDRPFTHPETGVQYPANWLRLSTLAEKEAIGIVEQPDPAPSAYDQRFYWGPGLPKDHAALVSLWTDTTRNTANTLLTPSDWVVIRELDNGKLADPAIKVWREAIRQESDAKIAAIEATADTEALAAYVSGGEYSVWPQLNPPADPEDPEGSTEPASVDPVPSEPESTPAG